MISVTWIHNCAEERALKLFARHVCLTRFTPPWAVDQRRDKLLVADDRIRPLSQLLVVERIPMFL